MLYLIKYLSIVIVFVIASSASGADTGWQEIGVRGGTGQRHGENFNQWEITAAYQLPWDWKLNSDWQINTRLNTSIGALDGESKTAAIFTLGPGLLLMSPDSSFSFEAGISPTLLSRNRFKKVDFGSAFQFTSFIGLNYSIDQHIIVNACFQHMSNAGIDDENEEFQKRFVAVLPKEFVAEFEKRFIRVRDSEVDRGKRRASRGQQVWKAAQKMIVAIGIEPTDWFYFTHEIYDYFHQKNTA